jgi:hypothetical protein
MQQFIAKYRDQLEGLVSGLDLRVFRGFRSSTLAHTEHP